MQMQHCIADGQAIQAKTGAAIDDRTRSMYKKLSFIYESCHWGDRWLRANNGQALNNREELDSVMTENISIRAWSFLLALAVGGSIAAGGARADELQLRYDNGIGSSHMINTGVNQFLEALSAEPSVNISATHYYGALQSMAEASGGLRDSVLDMGSIFPQYLPAEFPINNFITEIPAIVKTSVAITGANTEFLLLHCNVCLEEFTNQNQLPLIMHGNPTYRVVMGGNTRIVEPGDLVGKRLRAGGNYFRSWVEYFGGVAVNLPGSEVYEAINSGIVDGTVGVLSDVSGFGIEELVGSVTLVDVGAFHNGVFFGIRRNLWQELPVETRKLILELAIDGQAATSVSVDKEVQRIIDEVLPANDVELIEPSEAFNDAQATFVEHQIEAASNLARDERGISDAKELALRFLEITAKWTDLVNEIDVTDAAEVANLYREHIYSQIDTATFGM